MKTHEEWLAAYQWLVEALTPHCDEVISEVMDYDGYQFAIGCRWGEGSERKRRAFMVEHSFADYGFDYHFSANDHIERGLLSREAVIADLLRPPGTESNL